MKYAFTAAGLAAVTSAAPISSSLLLLPRGTLCGQWDSEVAGQYTVYNNLWGMDSATSGEQCTTNNGLDADGNLSWSVEWTWQGGEYNVKSYPNAVVEAEPVALSEVSSIPVVWDWTYTGDGMVANVAFDLFTSSSADGTAEYEFMIWLGALGGAGPISSTGEPIATVTLAGQSWSLYNGANAQLNVFSFVASSNAQSFSGDLAEFTSYLVSDHGVPASQILQSVGGGTEPFVGNNAVFTTSKYSSSVL